MSDQPWYFAEIGRNLRSCKDLGSNQKFEMISSEVTNEYDFQRENGVLNTLEGSWSFTYSVWPDASAKKDISYNIYQRSPFNYKLQCANSED